MKAIFNELLSSIPDYKEFLTAREMDASSFGLAEQFPDVVEIIDIGSTRAGNTLHCLRIGNDKTKPNALLLGCPHPNEPIGAMMLEYLSRQLAASAELREAFGYNCYILKAWDYDGLCMNEGWLKGPYTVGHYAAGVYRPASHLQVDWTFPLVHRDYAFTEVLPETEAVKKLIDETGPAFIYSLHNAGFGGVYWYISEAMPPEVYELMGKAAARQGVPLHLGEPEVPIVQELSPAIYRMGEVSDLYDFLYENMGPEAANGLGMGRNSAGYGKAECGAYSLLTELPFFFDKRICDMTPSDATRGECLLADLDFTDESDRDILSLIEKAAGLISPDNLFHTTLLSFTQSENTGARREMIGASEDSGDIVTQSQKFSMTVEPMFYKLLSFGMLVRLFDHELDITPDAGAETALRGFRKEAAELFESYKDRLLAQLNCEAVSIRKLVEIQLESGLIISSELLCKR